MAATPEITTTIEEQLRALIRLQYIDSRIDQIRKLRGDLPNEISDLDDEKAGLQTRIDNAKQEAKDNEVQRKKLQLDIAESEGLIKKYEEQQLQVRNNREYDALTKEIEAQRQRIENATQEIANLGVRDEENVGSVADAKERLGELDTLLKEKRAELGQVVEDTQKEQQGYEGLRNDAAEAIEERYLKAYNRLRGRMRDGRAVVPLVRGAAAGYAIPPQRQVEIRQRNRMIVCEHTGRMVVDEALFEETTGDMNI